MAEEKAEGFWQRVFGVKPAASSCCSMKVEEMTEEQSEKTAEGKDRSSSKEGSDCGPGSGCCCG